MHHEMHLNEIPFRRIQSGSKRVELRLNDEKRQLLQAGDVITFISRTQSAEKIEARIIELTQAPDFANLLTQLSPSCLGLTVAEFHDTPNRMQQYYSSDDLRRYGVVAIRFELVELR